MVREWDVGNCGYCKGYSFWNCYGLDEAVEMGS